MKCPSCQTASDKNQRAAAKGACPACGRMFRLDPPDPLSDFDVEACITRVSAKRKHSFSQAELTCEVERLVMKKAAVGRKLAGGAVTISAIVIALVSVHGSSRPGELVALVLFLWAARLFWARKRSDPRGARVVARYLSFASPTKLLLEPRPPALPQRSPAAEFDLHSFGFDRVVLVDDRELVDVLVANNFHFEHNAAIVSLDRYPAHVADLVQAQLREPGSAKVYLLHDCSGEAFSRAETFLATGFTGAAEVVRLGLWPKTAASLEPRMPPDGIAPDNLPDEVKRALAKESIPLAALRPQQLMTLLFNAFHQPPAIDAGGDGTIVVMTDYAVATEVAYDFG